MKNLKFVLLAILFVSCKPFITQIQPSIRTESISSDAPVYIFNSATNEMPDSATFIGNFTSYFLPSRADQAPSLTNDYMLAMSMETEAQEKGANLLLIDPEAKLSGKEILKGKAYFAKMDNRVQHNFDSLMKIIITKKLDSLEGIYEIDLSDYFEIKDNKSYLIQYAILKNDSNNYDMIYLKGFEKFRETYMFTILRNVWRPGDIFAKIKKTDKSYIFKAITYEYNKSINRKAMIKVDEGNLRITNQKGTSTYWKIFPEILAKQIIVGSGTGFGINTNRIVTCYHIVKSADKEIYVRGINGDFQNKHKAVVEKIDKDNDVAVLKLVDTSITIKENVFAYTEEERISAEEVFVLGYPISSIMGDEIKLTNGLISSTSGVGGDLNTYQISAPIQPGNSGSPLFDKNGNVIGMINSKIKKADNVGYAIKFKEIQNFLNSNGYSFMAKPVNTYSNIPLTDKLKTFQKSVYLVEIIEVKGLNTNAKKPTTGW